MIGALLISLAVSTEPTSQFERDLGFELPTPFIWQSDGPTDGPIYIYCNEPARSGCPHFDRGHWDYTGYVGAPRESEDWGDMPPLIELLLENGWIAVRPETGSQVTEFRKTDALEPGVCAKYISLDYGYRDALGVMLHIVPCIDEATQ